MNYCDDGGACHHNCADRSGKCYRRQCCEPLSNVFPNDEWPPPSGAEVHETDPTLSKPTPTSSITVGTQVRLTGVVSEIDSDGDIWIKIPDSISWQSFVILSSDKASVLEVIRQPFKRGEVVWHGTTELSVLADEEANTVLLVEPMAGAVAFGADANLFERRP